MQIVYATKMVPNMEGRTFKNPRHFLAPETKATKVFIDGDWPVVKEAYEKLGIPVAPISEMKPLKSADPAPQK